MYYKFVLEDFKAKKGKLSREEKRDILIYIEGVKVEADNEKKAIRAFANLLNGRLGRDSEESSAVITLPDYASSQIVVRAEKID